MQVAQYGRFEQAFCRKPVTGYPYGEAELEVDLFSPEGKKIHFWGFYDGEDYWKIRYMPDKIGTWRYRAYFSDGVPAGEGSFECVAGDIPGMICADMENPLWFGYSSGKHFFMRSFHVGDCFFAENWSEDSRIKFLDWAKVQGYNTLSIASFFVNRESYGRGMGWKTPRLWPLDAAEYRKAERILDLLSDYGFVVFPFAGFFGREGFNPTAYRDQVRYIKYIIARWGCYWNLLFNVAGPEPLLDVNPFMPRCEVDKLGGLIQQYDIYHHPLTVHNQTGHDQFQLASYRTYATLQGPKTTSLNDLRGGLLASHPPKGPLYAQETLWTDNIYGHPLYNDDELRRNAYVIAMSAASLNYGDMNGDSSSGFSGQPELEQRVQRRHDIVKRVWDTVCRFPYYQMKPDTKFAENGFSLADPARGQYLVFVSDASCLKLSQGESRKFDAIVIRADQKAEDIQTSFKQELSFPKQGDWLVYMKEGKG